MAVIGYQLIKLGPMLRPPGGSAAPRAAPPAEPLNVQIVEVRGPRGLQGPEGPAGTPVDPTAIDLPDLTLIFNNQLV